ncbi:GNAT family N-acetyltransferase [Paeniglutamicibacter sp.]|uniref:GNAT family N-acetyltransferase n=1 Tax=Paeniglutamicibacter sp. TaxID=1934391 RepID=UPI003989C5CA
MTTLALDDPTAPDVRRLLDEHLADMFAASPRDSVHALDHSALSAPEITFLTARDGGTLLACGALKELDPLHGEIKSMRTARPARGRGIAARLLGRIMDETRVRGYGRLYLETGSDDFFAPARRLYRRHGFTPCPPFGSYGADPYSVFMGMVLAASPAFPFWPPGPGIGR